MKKNGVLICRLIIHDRREIKSYIDKGMLKQKPMEQWMSDNLYFVANSFDEMLEKAFPEED